LSFTSAFPNRPPPAPLDVALLDGGLNKPWPGAPKGADAPVDPENSPALGAATGLAVAGEKRPWLGVAETAAAGVAVKRPWLGGVAEKRFWLGGAVKAVPPKTLDVVEGVACCGADDGDWMKEVEAPNVEPGAWGWGVDPKMDDDVLAAAGALEKKLLVWFG
jgi:hypothetical protein